MWYLRCSFHFLYIVRTSLATQHARCHKEYYSPRGRTVSTSHIWSLTCGGRFASAKRFCLFWSPSSQEKSIFHEISAPETCHRCNHAKPCPGSNFFCILWIELRFCMRKVMTSVAGGKILLAKTNWFFHDKSSIFRPKSIHSLRFTCHATCPLAQEYYSPRGGTVSTSHIGKPVGAPAFAKAKRFCIFESPQGLRNRTFS